MHTQTHGLGERDQKFTETLDGLYFLNQVKARLLSGHDGQRKVLE